MKAVKAIGVFIFILALTGTAQAAESRRHVSFIPQWIPQAQFAGYYVALEKGFYQGLGLEVSILRGGPKRPSAEWLKKGAADFGTMFLSTAIVEQAKGTRLVNIGQVISRSIWLNSGWRLARRSSSRKHRAIW
jgi:NitT/TauT family transport system substrate-binding protein